MTETKPAAEPRQTITPHLVVRDAAAASARYQRALGAEERGRIPVPGGRFMQVELRFGDSTVMLADEFPELGCSRRGRWGAPWAPWPSIPTTSTRCGSGPWRRERRFRSLAGDVWGDRHGEIFDPFGHRWGLAQHLRDVPAEEIRAAAVAMFGGDST